MGLLRIIHVLEAEQKCKPKSIDKGTFFYACTKDKCIIGRYDKGGVFSSNGEVYKLCMLFMQMSTFDRFVIKKLESMKKYYNTSLRTVYLAKS